MKRLARPGAIASQRTQRTYSELESSRFRPTAVAVGTEPNALAKILPRPKPLCHEAVGWVDLRGGHVTSEIAMERAVGRRKPKRVGALFAQKGSSELTGVGVDKKPAPAGHVLSNAIAVLEAMPELPNRIDVAKLGCAAAERESGAEILLALAHSGAIKEHHGECVRRRRMTALRGS